MQQLKDRLSRRERTIGSWITMDHPSIAEIMAQAGFDWLTVDMEHSAITISAALRLIQVIELSGVTPLVRVEENNHNYIKRIMDAGAHGVIVPMVNTAEEARRAVDAVKYPPMGKRGVGIARAQSYGPGFNKYQEWVKTKSVVIVQVEHVKAVENLEEILGVEGVDAFFVGPYDLSASMGNPGALDDPDMVAALKEIKRISEKLKVPSGFHVVAPDPQQVVERFEEGYTFLAYSTDFLFLGNKCREGLDAIRKSLR